MSIMEFVLDKKVYMPLRNRDMSVMKTVIMNQKRERDELLSRTYLMRHNKYDTRLLLANP